MSELPEGWADTTFSEVVETRSGNSKLIKGKLLNAPSAGAYPAFSASGQDVWTADYEREGDAVVVSAVGARCGKAFLASGKWSAVANTHVVQPTAAIDNRYLHLHLDNERFWQRGGTAQPFIKVGATLGGALKLPPRVEQQRIVAKIDSLTGTSNRARDHLDHVSRLADKYKQALLAAAFRGDLTGQRGHPVAPVRDFIRGLDQGWSPKCETEPAGPEDWAVIKTTAIQPIVFVPGENKRLPGHLVPRPGIVIGAGDVLITRAGPRSRVAISCVVTSDHPKLMLCDKAYRLRVEPNQMDSTFLVYMLNSPQCLAALEDMKTGISDSGLNLTQAKFLEILIPAISKVAQLEIVDRIRTAFTWIARVAAEATSAHKLIDHLDEAILAKAFRGELVPQDPADEPASVLLERIKSERAAAPARGRGRQRKTEVTHAHPS